MVEGGTVNRTGANIIQKLKKARIDFSQQNQKLELTFDYQDQAAADYIFERLNNDIPTMIARFGRTELLYMKSNIHNEPFWVKNQCKKSMHYNAGFFPPNLLQLEKFYEIMIKCIPNVDILGSWLHEEKLFKDLLKRTKTVPLKTL